MRLKFHVQGDGVSLIIIHGFLGSSDNWRAMRNRLAARSIDTADQFFHAATGFLWGD
jgi:hypothetical protein